MTGGPQRLNRVNLYGKIQFLWRSYKKCGGHGPHGETAYEVRHYNHENFVSALQDFKPAPCLCLITK